MPLSIGSRYKSTGRFGLFFFFSLLGLVKTCVLAGLFFFFLSLFSVCERHLSAVGLFSVVAAPGKTNDYTCAAIAPDISADFGFYSENFYENAKCTRLKTTAPTLFHAIALGLSPLPGQPDGVASLFSQKSRKTLGAAYHTHTEPTCAINSPSEEGWRARWALLREVQTILRGVGQFALLGSPSSRVGCRELLGAASPPRGRAEYFPRAFGTSQNVRRSAACPTAGRTAFPTASVSWRLRGAFRSQEDFRLCSVVGVFFFLVVMISLVFFFSFIFFFLLPKTPSKLGNSQQGTFRAVLENTEAKKCQG